MNKKDLSIYWKLKHFVRYVAWRDERIYAPIAKVRGTDHEAPDGHDLFVAGFPRSGNNFITWALRLFAEKDLSIGGSHLPPYINQSVRKNIPTVLTIRKPEESAISWSIFTDCPLDHSLKYYIQYYQLIEASRKSLIILDFEDFTKNLAGSLAEVSKIAPFLFEVNISQEEASERIFEAIDQRENRKFGTINENQAPRPSSNRDKIKTSLKEDLNSPAMTMLLGQANDVFERYKVLAIS